MITHPFHPLFGQRLMVLFTQHKRTGLVFVCEVEGRRRVSVRQEWTDRGVPASTDRLAVEGLTAARELVDAIDLTKDTQRSDVQGADEQFGQRPDARAGGGLGSPPGSDGSGEHGRVAATRRTRQ